VSRRYKAISTGEITACYVSALCNMSTVRTATVDNQTWDEAEQYESDAEPAVEMTMADYGPPGKAILTPGGGAGWIRELERRDPSTPRDQYVWSEVRVVSRHGSAGGHAGGWAQ
jgi:hypothetical protein